MPKILLTDISIRALKPPPSGQVTYWDKSLAGFGLRVSPGGTKTFVLVHGATRQRTTIGRQSVISLSEARTEAKRILAERTLGKGRPAKISFDEAKTLFLEVHEQRNKPRTVADYRRLLGRHFPFGRTQLADIRPEDISRRLEISSDASFSSSVPTGRKIENRVHATPSISWDDGPTLEKV